MALSAAGGDFKIYKNTLVRFAARELDLEVDDLLLGPTAIAFAPRGRRHPGDRWAEALRDSPGPTSTRGQGGCSARRSWASTR